MSWIDDIERNSPSPSGAAPSQRLVVLVTAKLQPEIATAARERLGVEMTLAVERSKVIIKGEEPGEKEMASSLSPFSLFFPFMAPLRRKAFGQRVPWVPP